MEKMVGLINWPLVVLILAVICVFLFKTAIRDLIYRLKSVRTPGFQAEATGTEAQDPRKQQELAGLYKLSDPDRAAADVSIPIHPAID